MESNRKYINRKSIRLKNYDYTSSGYYFITLVTKNRNQIFGKIEKGKVILNNYGKLLESELLKSEKMRNEISIDYYFIMPNHIHFIVIIEQEDNHDTQWANSRSPLQLRPKSLSSFISGFKAGFTTQLNTIRDTRGAEVWHRNFYEHVMRNEKELYETRKYIEYNPLNWKDDEYFQ